MINTINVVFRFLDFFVILGLIFYSVKKYIIPTAEKMLREQGVFLYNLESDCKNLQLQRQSILENIQDQERQFKSMQSNFALWQKKCDGLIKDQKAEQVKTDKVMHERYSVKLEHMKNNNVLQEQLPVILDDTTKSLQIKYRGASKQKLYIDTLTHVMKEQL